MGASEWTNRLLLLILIVSLAHLFLALADQPLGAETFRLDSCITPRPKDKPEAYLHVVVHGVADIDSRLDLAP